MPSIDLMAKVGAGRPKPVNIAKHVERKRVVLLGLPGAFTPC